MAVKFTNNASATLASSITNSATSISLTTGQGALFPSLSAGDFFYATLVDASNNLEIVKVTARSTDTLTVTRAQDGTTASAYAAGDKLELRPIAAVFSEFVQVTGAQTIAGVKTFSDGITANVTGNVTGNVSGNAGTVTNGVYTTGNQSISGTKTFSGIAFTDASFKAYVSGVSSIILLDDAGGAADYLQFTRDTNALYFNVNSSQKLGINSLGDLTATGNVTAYSDDRVKTNWRPVGGNFISGLASVKSGIYDRTDMEATHTGVSAQSLQTVLPEAVLEDIEGDLSVAYGNAALVAAIELAKEVVQLKARLEVLENK